MSTLLLLLALAQVDPELSGYVASRRKAMDDPARPIAERESVAIEVAAALDRAAWGAARPESRRADWEEARAILDGFSARNADHPRSRAFAYQAAVYLWAEGQSWMRHSERDPTDAASHAKAASALDGSAARLRPLAAALQGSDEPLAQNVRFRLARALSDRADLDPDRPAAPALRDEALAVIASRPVTEPSLKGFADLLRAELLARARRFDEASAALEESARDDSAPPIADRMAALVPIAAGAKDFAGARSAIDGAPLDAGAKAGLLVKLALAERSARDLGPARADAEVDAFRRVEAMRGSAPAEFRSSLLDLARAVDEPAAPVGPSGWALLAEGAALLGDTDRAARLDIVAAARSEASGDPAAARSRRYRAASILFQAGRYHRADLVLGRIVADPAAGPLRPRAGMLRALARGRGWASGDERIHRGDYVEALTDQVRDFPDDPTTGEARWLLGRARMDEGHPAEAEAMWESVPRTHPRWLASRIALADLRREALDERRIVDEPAALAPLRDKTRETLRQLRAEARDEGERADVILAEVRLDLVPGVGDPHLALDEVDRLLRLPLDAPQRSEADRLRIAALAASERFLDAEQAAREVSASPDGLIALARALDRLGSAGRSDRVALRVGGVERIVADRLADAKGLPPRLEAEVRLRRARGRLLSGDLSGARGLLLGWPDPSSAFGDDRDALSDLADLFSQVGDPTVAVSAYRHLGRVAPAGSPRWFAARLGHALALASARQPEAARKVVDGTALLHPDLGGPGMKARFDALRRSLDRQ